MATALAVALAGCGAVPEFPIVGPTAVLEYPRTLQAQRWIEVHVESEGGEDVMVTGGALFSPSFERLDAVEVGVRVYPGHDARVRLPLGDAVCPAGAGPSSAQLVIESDGAEVVQSVAVDDAVLAEINQNECLMQGVTDAAVPSLGLPGAIDDGALHTTITLTRAESSQSVVLTQAAGSVIFALEADAGELPAELVAGRLRLEVPVTIRVARCDPHAFAESKQTFLFKVWMSVGGGPETYVEMHAEGALMEVLQELFDACGEADRA